MPQSQGQWVDVTPDDEWEDVWEDLPQNPPAQQQQQPEQQGWLSRAWHTLSDPLWTGASEWAKNKATEMTDPNNKPGWLTGFAAGALEGAGNVADSMTSPLSIATLGAGGLEYGAARAGLPQIARLANTATRAASVPFAIHGAEEVTRPDATWGERVLGAAELAGGAAGALHAPTGRSTRTPTPKPTPEVAPALAEAVAPEVAPPRPHPAASVSAESGVDDLIRQLGVEGDLQTVDPFSGRVNNASGTAGGGSAEEILRQQSMKAKGDQFVVYDRTGNERPILGIDAQDYRAQPGEIFGVKHADGTFTMYDNNGGQVARMKPKPPTQPTPAPQPNIPESAMIPEMPPHLRGAKPRYNMGGTSYTPIFANDLDKAMYIIAQTKKSLRDSEYLQYVMDTTGMTENQARTAAIEMRNQLKTALRNQPAGEVKLPKLFQGKLPEAPPTTPIVPPDLAAGKGGKPPLKPPPPNAVPDPVPASPNAEPILVRIKEKQYPEAGLIRQAWNLSRGLMAVDLPFISSAGLRQGFRYVGSKNWFKAWLPSMKAYGSEAFYKGHRAMLEADPLMQRPIVPALKADGTQITKNGRPVYKETRSIAERAGVELGDLTSHLGREEAIRSQLAEKIPLYGRHVAASNRSYTAYINDLRLNAFRNLYEAMPDKNNEVALRQLGDAVNAFTGRGKLSVEIPKKTSYFGKEYNIPGGGHALSAERHANALAEVLFSPRLMVSRMQMLNPANYILAQPQVRREYLKAAVRMAGAWYTMAKIGELAGGEVSLDPTNSDFGKVKIGNIRLDPAAGFQQFLVLMSRLGTGEATSSVSGRTRTLGEGYRPDTRGSIVQQFLENKLHPSAKAFYDALFAQQGHPFRVGDRTAQMFVPMISDDLLSIAQESPELLPILAPLMSGGMGSQIYSGKEDYGAPGTPGKIMESMGIPDIVIGGR